MERKKICVIGLGYFGLNLALRLTDRGAEVLAIDIDEEKVLSIADKVAHAVTMDSTDKRALINQGVRDMNAVVVAIGEGFESSITTTAVLQEIGVTNIYNRVTSPIHERLVKLMGIEQRLVPEAEAAAHLAPKIVMPGIINSHEISSIHSIYEIEVPKQVIGKKLIDIGLRIKYNLNLVTVKHIEEQEVYYTKGEKLKETTIGVPNPDHIFQEKDVLVLFGQERDLVNFVDPQ